MIVLLAIVAGTSLVRLSEFNRARRRLRLGASAEGDRASRRWRTPAEDVPQMRDALILDDEKQVKESLSGRRRAAAQQRQALFDKIEKMLDAGRGARAVPGDR